SFDTDDMTSTSEIAVQFWNRPLTGRAVVTMSNLCIRQMRSVLARDTGGNALEPSGWRRRHRRRGRPTRLNGCTGGGG
ncbi:hypothetical protein, partial [Mycobacterium sp. E796]|uniref:hypothetical protein n=1 Tax=Mycobacterium sp. E796 TaxID=1834151 RepID=UPI001E5FAB96